MADAKGSYQRGRVYFNIHSVSQAKFWFTNETPIVIISLHLSPSSPTQKMRARFYIRQIAPMTQSRLHFLVPPYWIRIMDNQRGSRSINKIARKERYARLNWVGQDARGRHSFPMGFVAWNGEDWPRKLGILIEKLRLGTTECSKRLGNA